VGTGEGVNARLTSSMAGGSNDFFLFFFSFSAADSHAIGFAQLSTKKGAVWGIGGGTDV
jgi:hypothetical protein